MAIPIIGDIINGVKDIVSEVVVDRDKRDELNYKLKELEDRTNQRENERLLAQIGVNNTEASNSSLFVAGWRPAVGWISAISVGYTFLLMPLMSWVARVMLEYTGEFPSLDTDALMYLLLGMLGIGGMRSFEKAKGVASDNHQIQPTPIKVPASTTYTEKGTIENIRPSPSPAVEAVPLPSTNKKKWKLF